MRKKIVISKPYIKEYKSEIFGDAVRLCANITMTNPNTDIEETKECYFEFEKGYKKYLCPERSDAFVMGLLSSAMELDMDIEFETPLSERLYYQLTTYYVPMIAKYNSAYPMNKITLYGPTNNTLFKSEHAVVTGCSGGVDSFYTIARHNKKDIIDSYKLTHIIYNSSCSADIIEERIINNYIKTYKQMSKIANECKLDIIGCFNNIYKFYKFPFQAFNMFYTTTLAAAGFALQKLISIYYLSSGPSIKFFNLDVSKTGSHDASAFDLFTINCINNENIIFYSTGIETNRVEKQKYISDFVPAQNNLQVCSTTTYLKNESKFINCSFCEKCLRTMCHLYSLNKLSNFDKVFDLDKFYKNKSKIIGKFLANDKADYISEFKKICKKNKISIPMKSYMYCYLYFKPLSFFRNIFKNSLFARKLYYKFNLDYKLDGYRSPKYEAYKDKLKKK